MKKAKWRVIDTGIKDPFFNMALDEALLHSYKESDLPIVRFYSFSPSITVGRFQKLKNSIELERAKKYGIEIARRISGGGALVHKNDFCYSLILPRQRERSVKENYKYTCGFLINFYERLGFKAGFACDLEMEKKSSDICLAGNETYDILIDNKKIGGNAQRLTKNIFFLHGSVPNVLDEQFFSPCFINESGLNNAMSLEKLGVFLEYKELKKNILNSICENFDISIIEKELPKDIKENAFNLLNEKYLTNKWNIDGIS